MSRKYLVAGAAVVLFVVLAVIMNGVKGFWFARGGNDALAEITVQEGDTLASILPELQDAFGVRTFWLKVYAKLSGAGYLQPGVYMMPMNTSYAALFAALGNATTSEVSLTIPEGFSLAQIGERVRTTFPNITEEEWHRVTGMTSPLESHAFVVAMQKPDDVDLEGYLFPDTYRFFPDASAEAIVTTMLDEMQEKYDAVYAEHAMEITSRSLLLTGHDYLTLASIVEKEVRQPDTRATVAGIFMNRLRIGMALQSDATINYIIGGDDPSPTLADLETESPYNTYKNPGLPPGPIASPGLSALSAALAPTSTDYYYFLTTDDGRIYYAATHDEHVANKAQYLY